MKLQIKASEFEALPIYNQLFWALWKQKKGYPPVRECDFGQVVELSLALTNDLSYEDSDGRTFNNLLRYNEVHLGWDGAQPLDILWFELNEKLKRRINQHIVAYS